MLTIQHFHNQMFNLYQQASLSKQIIQITYLVTSFKTQIPHFYKLLIQINLLHK